jgi:hypothetical protein
MSDLPFHIEQPFTVVTQGNGQNPITQEFLNAIKGKKIFLGTKEEAEKTGLTFDMIYNGSKCEEFIDESGQWIEL